MGSIGDQFSFGSEDGATEIATLLDIHADGRLLQNDPICRAIAATRCAITSRTTGSHVFPEPVISCELSVETTEGGTSTRCNKSVRSDKTSMLHPGSTIVVLPDERTRPGPFNRAPTGNESRATDHASRHRPSQ